MNSDEIEKTKIVSALKMTFGNQRHAAKLLEMPKSTLHDKIKKFKIDVNTFKGATHGLSQA